MNALVSSGLSVWSVHVRLVPAWELAPATLASSHSLKTRWVKLAGYLVDRVIKIYGEKTL